MVVMTKLLTGTDSTTGTFSTVPVISTSITHLANSEVTVSCSTDELSLADERVPACTLLHVAFWCITTEHGLAASNMVPHNVDEVR